MYSETAICLSVSYLLDSPQITESSTGKEPARSPSQSIFFGAAWETVLYLAMLQQPSQLLIQL